MFLKLSFFLTAFYFTLIFFMLFSYIFWGNFSLFLNNVIDLSLKTPNSILYSITNFKNIAFLFFILFFIFLALNVITSSNSMTSLLFLIVIYFFSGSILILHKLEFFGLLYIIVYVGAIAVLFLFVIMMLKFKKKDLKSQFKGYIIFTLILMHCY